MINYKSPTCNAPIPAFPRVHMDGAAASALAKARLEVQNMHPWTQEMIRYRLRLYNLHSFLLLKLEGGKGENRN